MTNSCKIETIKGVKLKFSFYLLIFFFETYKLFYVLRIVAIIFIIRKLQSMIKIIKNFYKSWHLKAKMFRNFKDFR